MNKKYFSIILEGVDVWNNWRLGNPDITPNLSNLDFGNMNLSEINFEGIDLTRTNLSGANLSFANLNRANLYMANLNNVKLNNANLCEAKLISAQLINAELSRASINSAFLKRADLCYATLNETDFIGSDLRLTNFCRANMEGADLSYCRLIETNLCSTNLTNCRIHGVSAWNVITDENTKQSNLIISKPDEPDITTDNLEIAQFIYLMLNNKKIRAVLDSITSKVVLILGRFYTERKVVLDAIRSELRKYDYIPIIFDFEETANRDVKETVSTLAHMSKFVIADITDPSSIPLELQTIVPALPSVPVMPILQDGFKEFSMFKSLQHYPWVMKTFKYKNCYEVINLIKEKIIIPSEEMAARLKP